MAQTMKCTVTSVLVKYPHGVQAEDTTEAALTQMILTKVPDDPARQGDLTATFLGDLRTEFPEGSTVTVAISAPVATE